MKAVGHLASYLNVWTNADPTLGGYLSSSLTYLETPAIDLSQAVAPSLSFALYYANETPGGGPEDYDGWDGCNVWVSVDGGLSWSVILGTPAYTCNSLYGFGENFGYGPGIPGWGGQSEGWQNAWFSLSAFIGQPDVRIRFMFGADISYDTLDDPSLVGMQIDNVLVADGATLWADDGVTNTGGLPTHGYQLFGNTWEHTGTEWHAGEGVNLDCNVESPWIPYTTPAILNVSQDIRCDLPDSDGDLDGFLEDYFYIEYTIDDENWNTLTYDYAGETRPDWLSSYYTYTHADVFNGSLRLTLTEGSQLKLRYRLRTDANTDGGEGTGLWVDNVHVVASTVPTHDLGVNKAWINYPRNVTVSQLPSAEVTNYGAVAQENVRVWWRVLSDSTGAVVRARQPLNQSSFTVPVLSSNRVSQTAAVPNPWEWFPALPGTYRVQFWTELLGDENHDNDTLEISVSIIESNSGFLRYNYDSSSAWTIEQNNGDNGYLVRYDPINSPWTAEYFFARIYNMEAGDTLHFVVHGPGIDSLAAGPLLGEYTTTITGPEDVYPNYLIRYVGAIPELRCVSTPIWMGLRSNPSNTCGIVGLSENDGGPYWEGHSFSHDYVFDWTSPWPGDLDMFLQVDWEVESPLPFPVDLSCQRLIGEEGPTDWLTLSWSSPGPVDGYRVYRSWAADFSLPELVAELPSNVTTWQDLMDPEGVALYRVVGYNAPCVIPAP